MVSAELWEWFCMMFDESEEMQEVFDAKRECVWVTKADMSICCGLYNVKSDDVRF